MKGRNNGRPRSGVIRLRYIILNNDPKNKPARKMLNPDLKLGCRGRENEG